MKNQIIESCSTPEEFELTIKDLDRKVSKLEEQIKRIQEVENIISAELQGNLLDKPINEN